MFGGCRYFSLQKGFSADSAVGDDRRTEFNEAFSQTRVIAECELLIR